MNRRTFFSESMQLLSLLSLTVLLGACGKDSNTRIVSNGSGENDQEDEESNNGEPLGNSCDSDATAVINNPHGHTITVSQDDVEAATTKDYDIQGSSGHNHVLTLTTSDFIKLSNGETIEKFSDLSGGHFHLITIRC